MRVPKHVSGGPARGAINGRLRGLVLVGALFGLAVVIGGCGSSSTTTGQVASSSSSSSAASSGEPAPAPAGSAESGRRVDQASIAMGSKARLRNGLVDPQYTCDGADVSPPMVWADVPPTTKELVLVVRSLSAGSLETAWSVAGIKPSVNRILAGEVPPGGVVGTNSHGKVGYSLCPPANKPALVVFGLWAVPSNLSFKHGFSVRALAAVEDNPEVAWGSMTMHWH